MLPAFATEPQEIGNKPKYDGLVCTFDKTKSLSESSIIASADLPNDNGLIIARQLAPGLDIKSDGPTNTGQSISDIGAAMIADCRSRKALSSPQL